MSYNNLACGTTRGNTGLAQCAEDFGYPEFFILTPIDFSMTIANAQLLATWAAAINDDQSDRIYPLPRIFKRELDSEDDQYEEGDGGKIDFLREGKIKGTYHFEDISLCNHKQLRKHNGTKNRVFTITNTGYILGTTADDINFKGILLDLFRVEKRGQGTPENKQRTKIRIQENDPAEWNDRGYWINPPEASTAWNALDELVGLKDVNIAVVSSSSATVILSVTTNCGGEVVTGMAEGDFTITGAVEGAQTASSFTDNGDGTYTFTFAPALSADTYTCALADPADQTTQGYEQFNTSPTFVIT